jgi:hypothetical protein
MEGTPVGAVGNALNSLLLWKKSKRATIGKSSDIMKSQGFPDFQAPPPIPKFIDAQEAIDEIPSYDSIEPAPDDF